MTAFLLPALFAILLWWGGTGVVLVLDRLAPRTFPRTLRISLAVAVLTLCAVAVLARIDGVAAVYLSFVAALILWGCNELAFLMGYLTGPRRSPCPPGLTGLGRFRAATETVITHEMALFATLVFIALASIGATNPTALWTFAALWALRLSAKFNIFLGVPNTGEELLPPHAAYLASYFRKRAMNALFPCSITLATTAVIILGGLALDQAADPAKFAMMALLASLIALGLIEHWMMVLPIQASLPWHVFIGRRLEANSAKPGPAGGAA